MYALFGIGPIRRMHIATQFELEKHAQIWSSFLCHTVGSWWLVVGVTLVNWFVAVFLQSFFQRSKLIGPLEVSTVNRYGIFTKEHKLLTINETKTKRLTRTNIPKYGKCANIKHWTFHAYALHIENGNSVFDSQRCTDNSAQICHNCLEKVGNYIQRMLRTDISISMNFNNAIAGLCVYAN